MTGRADVIAKSDGGFVEMGGRVGLSRGGQTLIGITACGWFFRRIAGRWIRGGTAFEALNGIYTAPRTTCDLVS
jgi:hypothetical protein